MLGQTIFIISHIEAESPQCIGAGTLREKEGLRLGCVKAANQQGSRSAVIELQELSLGGYETCGPSPCGQSPILL